MNGSFKCLMVIQFTVRYFSFMKKKAEFKTYSQLLDNLRNHGLIISGEKISQEILKTRGYYNLVNRYKNDLYLKGKTEFDGTITTIETLYHFHRMEDDLRNLLFRFTTSFEQYLKESMSYALSSNYGVNPNDYLNPDHYGSRHKSRVLSILAQISNIQNSSRNPTKYYRENYDCIPPWILLDNAMFGQTKMFFMIFPKKLKRYVIHQMLPFDFIDYQYKYLKKETTDQLSKERINWVKHIPKTVKSRLPKNLFGDRLYDELYYKMDERFFKDQPNLPLQSKLQLVIDEERIDMFNNMLSAIHNFRNTLAHGARIVHFTFDRNLKLDYIKKYTGAQINTTKFKKDNLGNGIFGILLALLITSDKFDSGLLIKKLYNWQKESTQSFKDKKDYDLFLRSCGLPNDFVSKLSEIRKSLYATQKDFKDPFLSL